MLRTLLFAALLGVVTANNHTNTTEATTTVAPTPVITASVIFDGKVTFTSGNFTSPVACLASVVCKDSTKKYIQDSIVAAKAGVPTPEIFLLSISKGSLKVAYRAVFPDGTLAAALPSSAQITVQLGIVANQPASLRPIQDASSGVFAALVDAGIVVKTGICTFKQYADKDCLGAMTATTNNVKVDLPATAAAVVTAAASGSACGVFPGQTATIAIDQYVKNGAFTYSSLAGTSCSGQGYVKGYLGLTCLAVGSSTTSYIRASCSDGIVVPTSNAVGAGLSVAATVVAFLMM